MFMVFSNFLLWAVYPSMWVIILIRYNSIGRERIKQFSTTIEIKWTKIHFYNLTSLKSGSQLPKKNCFICFNESPLKKVKNAFYFILKALFVLKMFKYLSRVFGHVGKTAWLERYDWFQNLWRHSLVNKQLQYTYYPISHEVKATRQWNLVSF